MDVSQPACPDGAELARSAIQVAPDPFPAAPSIRLQKRQRFGYMKAQHRGNKNQAFQS